jgi:hypothetical protein
VLLHADACCYVACLQSLQGTSHRHRSGLSAVQCNSSCITTCAMQTVLCHVLSYTNQLYARQ